MKIDNEPMSMPMLPKKTGNRGISQMVKRHATTHDHPSQFNLTGVDGVDVRVLITLIPQIERSVFMAGNL
jgi:hypothetical protein